MAAAAIVVFFSWVSVTRADGRPWVVATHPLSAGATLSSADLRTASMRLPGATAEQAFSDPGSLVGRILAGAVDSGGLVEAASLVPPGQGPLLRPVSVSDTSVDLDDLQPGQAVDVLETSGSNEQTTTTTIVRQARVLSLSRATGGLISGSDTGVVTLGVDSLAEVESVVQAEHAGTITVVIAEPSDGSGLGGDTVGPGGQPSAGD